MAKTTPDWNSLNLLAFQGRIVRKSDGQIVKVAAPPAYAEVTGKPGEPVSVKIVFGSIPQVPVRTHDRRRNPFPYPGMQRCRTSDRW